MSGFLTVVLKAFVAVTGIGMWHRIKTESGKSVIGLAGSTAPMSSLKGYKLSSFPADLSAGAIIAALSIPIAMGYAQIAGLPASYGLLASVVVALAFALFTATGTIVFGMDSATSAITGAALLQLGYTFASDELIAVMPLFSLLTAAFLLLFAVCRVGKLIRLVPIPVMNGFIVGVSISVVISQIPQLTGINVAASSNFFVKCASILVALPQTNLLSFAIGVVSIVAIFVFQKKLPKVPGALIALLVMTVLSTLFNFESYGVDVLGTVSMAVPKIAFPQMSAMQLFDIAGFAFVVALISALESLLCLETFSIRAGIRANGDRELLSFGLANLCGGLFGCAPCSASVSRTAAGVDAGARTQVAGISGALIVALVAIVFAPMLYALPSSCLSAIVIVALINVIDARTIRRYAEHMKPELVVFGTSAVVVLVFGALYGVAVGMAISVAMIFYRKRRDKGEALFGVLPRPKMSSPSKDSVSLDPGVDYILFKMSGNVTFLNIDRTIDALLAEMTPTTQAVIIKMSKVDIIDATATVKLLQLVDMLHARKIHVKVVRKMRPTSDGYTRYELGSIMQDAKAYPNVKSALAALAQDIALERAHGKVDGNLGDRPKISKKQRKNHSFDIVENDVPVFSIHDSATNETVTMLTGRIDFLRSKEAVNFEVEAKLHAKPGTFPILSAVITRAATGELLAEFDDGKWDLNCPEETLKPAVDALVKHLTRS